ncbi:MAG TPA: hypothetical protein VGT60_12850 [Candidatus Limnocylindria bacterium]|nr:hypothetical protein [Candidatus Limnocylindria bacterium]
MSDLVARLARIRATDPDAIARALAGRRRRPLLRDGKLFLVAADHTARGVLAAGGDPRAMADRGRLLVRLVEALAHPAVDGVLATADLVDDLALLGALDDKVVFGSMNRGGLAGSVFELDDRFTGYTAAAIARCGLDGGKLMLRVADDDPGTVRTMVACARAIDELGALGLPAMVEVFASRTVDGKTTNDLSVDATMRAIAITSGLGSTSAHVWLKLPVVEEGVPPGASMGRLLSATTLPVVLLGGDPGEDRDATYQRWAVSMALPQVRGLVAGRTLLYPPDGNVAAAVDAAASIVRPTVRA